MQPLPDIDRALIEAYRRATTHSGDHINQSLERVLARIAAREIPPLARTPSRAFPGWTASLARPVVWVLGLGVLVTGVAFWGSRQTPEASDPALSGAASVPVQDLPRPEPPPGLALDPELAPRSDTEPPPSWTVTPRVAPSSHAGNHPTDPRAPTPPSLRVQRPTASSSSPARVEEIRLMGRARRAIQQGDPAGALELLDQHARRFPEGQLRRDREVSRVTALCAAGRESEARALALRLRPHAPGIRQGQWTGCPVKHR